LTSAIGVPAGAAGGFWLLFPELASGGNTGGGGGGW